VPLMKKASKKAFQHNVSVEMDAHPDKRKQDLAIAYSVQRQAKKKKMAEGGSVESGSRDMNMAEGGNIYYNPRDPNPLDTSLLSNTRRTPAPKKDPIPIDKSLLSNTKKPKKKYAEGGSISASNQKRPMPNDLHDDEIMERQNRGNKPSRNDSWTDKSTEAQAMANDVRGKKLPIKRPKMVPTNAFSTRLYDQEGQLEESASPGPYGEQPSKWHDEEDAKKMGKSPDMADEHSTHRKPYAKGGEVESSDYDHPANKYEQDLNGDAPSEDEGASMAMSHNESMPMSDASNPDEEEPHNKEEKFGTRDGIFTFPREKKANGGEIGHSPDDSEDQPMDEADEEHHNSIAAAIMARRDRLHAEIDSGAHDLDSAVRMAEGGILSHDSIYSDDSDQADLSRNHDEDANEEDQLSFNALRKENYNSSNLDVENPSDSGEMGDSEESDSENRHDMISSIRRKMKSKRQFSQD